MKRVVIIALMLAAISGTTAVNAQSWLRGLGRAAENAAKRAVERNVESATERAIDRAFSETEDAVEDAVTGESSNQGKKNKNKNNDNNGNNNNADEAYDNGNGDATAQSGQQKPQSLEMTYAKSDFVPGDEIIFEDNQANEQMGEFPSQWDLLEGTVEIAQMNGEKVILYSSNSTIAPLMKDMKNYLPEKFTIEFDFWRFKNTYTFSYRLWMYKENSRVFDLYWGNDEVSWGYSVPSGERRSGNERDVWESVENVEGWNHLAISFNQRAMKVYLNGTRIANIPNMDAPTNFSINGIQHQKEYKVAIKNVRIAKGAVPLYDRMMSEGKFITYGITFDVGKATIKPESMGEINRIVQLMTENPDLKFSVEGHTDNTGKEASNQTLSEQRSQAIVAKLVELGIAQDRLTAVGKGQNSPIADNNTDEGRAKNRRVEFVKM